MQAGRHVSSDLGYDIFQSSTGFLAYRGPAYRGPNPIACRNRLEHLIDNVTEQ
jgi:hypothetical protein